VAVNEGGQVLVQDMSSGRSAVWKGGRWVDLGSLGRGQTRAEAINDHGWIVGQSLTRSKQPHAFLWRSGRMIAVGPSGIPSDAVAINKGGDVLVNTFDGGVFNAYLWRHGKLTLVGPESGAALNDAGDVVGYDGSRGFLWSRGTRTNLGTLPAGAWPPDEKQIVEPKAINNRGDVVGFVHGEVAGSRWFLWRNGQMFTRRTSARACEEGVRSLNALGEVLISASDCSGPQGFHALVFRDGKLTRIPTLGGPASHGAALNRAGQVAGMSSRLRRRAQPFVWQPGRLVALNTPARRYTPPWPDVVAMNDHSEVVGYDYTAHGQHIIIWTAS
jgi:probable HAF family extracellular repeat protein